MDDKQNPFENKGNPVSDAEIKSRIDHSGEWHPEYDHTVKSKPPEDLKGE